VEVFKFFIISNIRGYLLWKRLNSQQFHSI